MTMITPSYLGETIEYSSLHACRSTLEDPTVWPRGWQRLQRVPNTLVHSPQLAAYIAGAEIMIANSATGAYPAS